MSNIPKVRKCPICKRVYSERPAISRRDNKAEICPDCGTMEALEDMRKYMSDLKQEGGKNEF